jgi:hypothetical protein
MPSAIDGIACDLSIVDRNDGCGNRVEMLLNGHCWLCRSLVPDGDGPHLSAIRVVSCVRQVVRDLPQQNGLMARSTDAIRNPPPAAVLTDLQATISLAMVLGVPARGRHRVSESHLGNRPPSLQSRRCQWCLAVVLSLCAATAGVLYQHNDGSQRAAGSCTPVDDDRCTGAADASEFAGRPGRLSPASA